MPDPSFNTDGRDKAAHRRGIQTLALSYHANIRGSIHVS